MNEKRNYSIDVLKFFAVFMITNSHLAICYPDGLKSLSTGAVIGNALFFFCSGFTLFLGKSLSFDNWYKRRIQRILPTLIAVSLIGVWLFGQDVLVTEAFTGSRFWFVSTILVYYLLFYPILRYGKRHLHLLFVAACLIFLVIWFTYFQGTYYGSNEGNCRRVFYFIYMLQGAIIGLNSREYTFKVWHVPALIVSLVGWYGVLYFTFGTPWHILSAIPLLGITRFGYSVCDAPFFGKLYARRYAGRAIYVMGGLCLEVYVVQWFFFGPHLNSRYFPLNLIVLMALIFVGAYTLRVCSNFIRQTFEREPYRWRELWVI
jgi:hypothetical protein